MGALLPEVNTAWQSSNAKVAYSFIVDQCCSRACFIFDIYPLKRWSCSPLTPPPPGTQTLPLSTAGNQVFLEEVLPFLCFCSFLF